jgi:hypothetical protein
MTVSTKEVELIVGLINTNAKANDDAHGDIVRRLEELGTRVGTTFASVEKHCSEREVKVDKALAELAPKKYTAWQSAKGLSKLTALSLGEAGVIVGLLKAFGVLH